MATLPDADPVNSFDFFTGSTFAAPPGMLTPRLLALALCASFMAPAVALAQKATKPVPNPVLDNVLSDAAARGARPRVIVQFRPGTSNKVRQRIGAEGGEITRENPRGNAL